MIVLRGPSKNPSETETVEMKMFTWPISQKQTIYKQPINTHLNKKTLNLVKRLL